MEFSELENILEGSILMSLWTRHLVVHVEVSSLGQCLGQREGTQEEVI